MRAVIQRVTDADVSTQGNITGKIDNGFVALIGVEEGDEDKDIEYIAKKTANLRVFEDENGLMNLSLKDTGGSILAVSQFTLLGDVRKGYRPSFIKAAKPETANEIYEKLISRWEDEYGIHVEKGVFRAEMLVRINNDGPVTIMIDSRKLF